MRAPLTGFGELVVSLGIASRNHNIDPRETARRKGFARAKAELEKKSATGVISTSDFAVSSPLETLAIGTAARPNSLFGHVVENCRPLSNFHARVNVSDTAKISASVITEAVAIPVEHTAADSIIVDPGHVGVIITYPVELLADPQAVAVVEADWQTVAQRGGDGSLLAALAPDSSSSFSATANSATDMRELFGALGDLSGIQPPVLAASPATLLRIGLVRDAGGWLWPEVGLHGGYMLGCPIFPCDALPDGTLRAMSVEAVACKFGNLQVSVSAEATVQMDTSPTQSAASGTGSTAVSFYQSAVIGVRYTLDYAVLPLRDTTSAELVGINW